MMIETGRDLTKGKKSEYHGGYLTLKNR